MYIAQCLWKVYTIVGVSALAYKEKSDAIKYNNEFIKQAYDRINLTVPKGHKEKIQAAAALCGESVNAYINKAISDRMERDNSSQQ